MKNKALVLCRDPEDFEINIQNLNLPELEVHIPRTEEEILKMIADVNIIFGNPNIACKYINQATKLKWMQSSFAGIDALNAPDLKKDYLLTIVKDTYGQVMAEYVLAYILMFERQIIENIKWQSEKLWNQTASKTLDSITLGILGTGSIGSDIAKNAKNFGIRVLGFRSEKKEVEHFDKIYDQSSIGELMQQSDYVVCVLPNTKSTKNIINYDLLSKMKESAVFLNIGRGDSLVEKDLIRILAERKVKAAVLDVFKEEPLPKEHAFWTLKNVYLTPHTSGYLITDKFFKIFEENYARFNAGEDLVYKVDFDKGY